MQTKDVFISYKAEEIEDADWVRSTLESHGISCWMAPNCISGGSSYATEIPQAIRNCKIFVLILSSKAQASKWVAREVDLAINEEKTVMPFMLENCGLRDDFKFYLTNVQCYPAYENRASAAEKLIKDIQAALNPPAPVSPQPAPVQPVTPAQPVYSQPAQPVYSQPAQPVYSQPAQPVYSQPAQPAYQPPVWQQPAPAPQKSGKPWIAVLIVALALVVIGGVIAAVALLSSDDDTGSSRSEASSKAAASSSAENIRLTKSTIQGVWATTFTMMEAAEFSDDADTIEMLSYFDTDASIDMLFCFYSDGSVQLALDKSQCETMFRVFYDDFVSWLRAGGMYTIYEEQGYSKEEVDEQLDELDMTMDELIDEMAAEFDADAAAEAFAQELEERDGMLLLGAPGEYTLTDDCFILTSEDGVEERFFYEYDGTSMTITDAEGEGLDVYINKVLTKIE